MFAKISVVLFVSFLNFYAFAQEPASDLISKSENCVCEKDVKDPFEEPVKFNFGKNLNACVDSCRFRPAKILMDNKSIKIGPQDMLIANFLHLAKYQMALIPMDHIVKVEMGFEEFAPKINHIFMRFTFDPKFPVKIYDQRSDNKLATQTNTVIVSAEGVPAKDQPYTLLDGFLENYLLLNRLQSNEEVERMNETYKHAFTYYELSVSPEQAQAILKAGIKQSESEGLKKVYKLFSANCSTTALGLLDPTIKYPAQASFKALEEALPIEAPWGLLQALKDRRILAPKAAK